MFAAAVIALALSIVASAQTVHDVQVGSPEGDLKFDPPAIFAQTGDTVKFTFHQKNHSVVRTSLTAPCTPTTDDGFSAPFFPVPLGQSDNLPTYSITVKDTKPIWVTCPQTIPAIHCHKGMVFAVNCGPDGAPNSVASFKAAAIALGANDPPAAPPAASGAPNSNPDTPSSITIPPAPPVSTVTDVVSVASSVWTTTYGSYPNSPAPTPNSLEGNVITIEVGANGNLTYSPSFVQARPRDKLNFKFMAKNHTVTQSTFENPCVKLNNATIGKVGFDSDFQPVPAGSSDFPEFNVTVNDTAPIWIYCRQKNPKSHCGLGMVMAINSDESSPRSSAAFKALAMAMNGTGNSASPTSSSTAPSPSRSSAADHTTSVGAAGLIATIISGIMAMF